MKKPTATTKRPVGFRQLPAGFIGKIWLKIDIAWV